MVVAASYHSVDATGVLADAGADPNVADKSGTTPLHTAAQLGELDLVKKLLAKGANPNARSAKVTGAAGGGPFRRVIGELTPLHVAAKANHVDVMRTLVAAGADPVIKAQGNTALLISAAGSGHLDAVKYAHELAPEIDTVSDFGTTPMHAAVTGTMTVSTQQKICEVIQFLADKGAKLDEKDRTGRTPMAIADILPIDKGVELLDTTHRQVWGDAESCQQTLIVSGFQTSRLVSICDSASAVRPRGVASVRRDIRESRRRCRPFACMSRNAAGRCMQAAAG